MPNGLLKQFMDLSGKPVLIHSLNVIESAQEIDAAVLVLPQDRPRFIDQEIDQPKVCSITGGGPTRQASLSQGLVCLPDETDIVVVHDAARPLASPALFGSVVNGIRQGFHGCVAALTMDDAVKEVSSSGEIHGSRSKTGLWRAQTPQAFLRSPLEDALTRADAEGIEAEDCSELLIRAGYRVSVVEGEVSNLKVTRPKDLWLCESILASGSV
jgi:2-C-methyl-D-erythritol 4-phosphate cytidylyltransferase